MNSNPDVSFSEQSTSKDKVLAIINLDLGSGNEVLVIKKGQDLRQLAQEICFKNQIDSQHVDFIVENIQQQINQIQNKQIPKKKKKKKQDAQKTSNANHYEIWQKFMNENKGNENVDLAAVMTVMSSQDRDTKEPKFQVPPPHHNKLYEEGVEKIKQREILHQDKLKQKIIQEEDSTTQHSFHPKISPKSQNKDRKDQKIEEYLLQEADDKKKRQEIAQQLYEELQLSQCTFKPYVYSVSKQLAMKQQKDDTLHPQNETKGKRYTTKNTSKKYKRDLSQGNIHERLYKQAQLDNTYKKQYLQEQFNFHYPFTPQLGFGKDRKIPERSQKEFTERLLTEKKKWDLENEIKYYKSTQPFDKVTGRPLFTPTFNKDEYYKKVSEKVDKIDEGITLYAKQMRSLTPVLSTKNTIKKDIQTPKKIHNKIDNQFFLLDKIKATFELLDSDRDGYISSEKVDIGDVPLIVLEIIQNILFEMEENNTKYDLQQFIEKIREHGLADQLRVIFGLKNTDQNKVQLSEYEQNRNLIRKNKK